MKRTLLSAVLLLLIVCPGFSQLNDANKSVSLGFQLSQFENDFGLGFSLTSPYFLQNKAAIRLDYNFTWHEHLQNTSFTWSNYSNLSIGFTSIVAEFDDKFRAYGEGGFIMLFPSENFSSVSVEFGGYGLIGLEVLASSHSSIFFEMGALGTGARTSDVIGSRIYSNGFLLGTGFRYNL